jgi:hypothetical protein
MPLFSSSTEQPTRIALSRGDAGVVLGVLGAVGAGVGLVVPRLARWLLDVPWLPVGEPTRGLLGLPGTVPGWVLSVVVGLVGVVAGAVLAGMTPVISVSRREVVITAPGRRERFGRSQVAQATVAGGHLVLHDAADVELVHEKVEGDTEALADALRHHGWDGPGRFPDLR